MKIKVCLVSLGCEKNLVDSETILGLFKKADCEIVTDKYEANLIIINTCGFIESAKKEALDTIMEYAAIKEQTGAKLVVCGCLAQRYTEELKVSLPEADAIIPIKDYGKMGDILKQLMAYEGFNTLCPTLEERVIATPAYQAYVKLGDGCNNRCAYCAIPLIRGSMVSESIDSVLNQVKHFLKEGRKEIILIAQDTSSYGKDIHTSLATLLKSLVKLEGVEKDQVWIRLLYLYPDEINEELINVLREHQDVIIPYFDIPLQHASEKILRWMRRRGSSEKYLALINHMRDMIPSAIFRTTMIVGFPHESEKDFNILNDFVKKAKFDHLGAFTYSREENTPAYTMNDQVPERIKKERLNTLMTTQRRVSLERNERHIGQIYLCLIEGQEDDNLYTGRSYAFAPDDIDGCIYVESTEPLTVGQFVKVKIIDAENYDLKAVIEK